MRIEFPQHILATFQTGIEIAMENENIPTHRALLTAPEEDVIFPDGVWNIFERIAIWALKI